jgi:hypothetical protein
MPPQQFESDRSPWFVTGCSTLFALPFFAAGVMVLRNGFQALHRHDGGAAILIAVGLAFSAFSVGIVAMVWFGMRRIATTMHRRRQFASQPWLWREDWAERRIAEPLSPSGPLLLVFAIVWNAITVPAMAILFRSPDRLPALVYFVLLFPVAGIVLLVTAVYVLARRVKFGPSVCTLERVPIVPGSTLRGEIRHRGATVPEGGYELALQCVERIVTGSGRSRSVTEDLLWESSQRIGGGVAAPTPEGMRVPFSFEVPLDARSTDLREPNDTILWRLVATADLPGIDYKASFELPVFETAAGDREAEIAAYHLAHLDEAARRELPADAHIAETPLPTGGTEFRIGPRRDGGSLGTFIVISVIWWGAIAMMWRLHVPIPITIIFALFGVLIAAMALDYVLGRSIVAADGAGLRIRREWLGAGTTVTLASADVDSLAAKVSGHTNNRPFYEVEAHLARGATATVARYLRSRIEAETLAAKIWRAMGRG